MENAAAELTLSSQLVRGNNDELAIALEKVSAEDCLQR